MKALTSLCTELASGEAKPVGAMFTLALSFDPGKVHNLHATVRGAEADFRIGARSYRVTVEPIADPADAEVEAAIQADYENNPDPFETE